MMLSFHSCRAYKTLLCFLFISSVSLSVADYPDGLFETNPGALWKSVQNHMSDLKKMSKMAASEMADLMIDETKAIEKAILGSENAEEDTVAVTTVGPSTTALTTDGPVTSKDATTIDQSSSSAPPTTISEDVDSESEEAEFNPFSGNLFADIFGHQFPSMFSVLRSKKPWWHGKNVCVDRQEKNETKEEAEIGMGPKHFVMFGASQFTTCKQTPSKYVCTTVVSQPSITKTVTVTYQCCHGFRRSKDSNACSKVDMKPAMEILNDIGAKEFVSMIKSAGLEEKLDAQNLTIFVPSDTALKAYEERMQENNRIDAATRRRRQSQDNNEVVSGSEVTPATPRVSYNKEMLLSHMIPGLVELAEFSNDMVLPTEQNTTMRPYMYYTKQPPIVTANCVPISSPDNFAANTVVHMVDQVLPVVNKNLMQLLEQPQFSEFRKLLENNDMLENLSKEGAITVLAPTNEAIKKIDSGLRAKYSRGESCIKTVLKHHILPYVLCSAGVDGTRVSAENFAGDWIHIHADESGRLLLDDRARVIQPDMVATNGVLHGIDKILSPKAAKPVSEMLSSSNHSIWLNLMERAGIIDELNNANNLTLFIPSESVLNNTETRAKLESLDEAALRDVLLYHAGQNGCLDEEGMMESFIPAQKLRVGSYSPIPMFTGLAARRTVECARIMKRDGKACNSVVYEIDRLISPPNATVLQVIETDPSLSTFRDAMKGTKIEEDLKALSENSYTLLAPTNEAFQKLSEETRKNLMEDKDLADAVLRRHVVLDNICCSGVGMIRWPFTKTVETMSGRSIEVNRDNNDRVRFAGNKVVKCDQLATDGIVHHVSNVFMPKSSPVIKSGSVVFGNPQMEVHLYGV